jgi:hypothetical protein
MIAIFRVLWPRWITKVDASVLVLGQIERAEVRIQKVEVSNGRIYVHRSWFNSGLSPERIAGDLSKVLSRAPDEGLGPGLKYRDEWSVDSRDPSVISLNICARSGFYRNMWGDDKRLFVRFGYMNVNMILEKSHAMGGSGVLPFCHVSCRKAVFPHDKEILIGFSASHLQDTSLVNQSIWPKYVICWADS